MNPAHRVRAFSEWEGRVQPPVHRHAHGDPFAPPQVTRTVAVRPGDSLINVLTRAGVEAVEAQAAIDSLRQKFNPRRELRAGQELRLIFGGEDARRPEAAEARLIGLTVPVSYDRDIAVRREGPDGFRAEEVERPLERRLLRAEGVISSSLFKDGAEAGLAPNALVELIRIYSFDVDFQREVRNGDSFEVLFSQYFDDRGRPVKGGEIEYARLNLRDRDLPLYRFETSNGRVDYFTPEGESVRKALLRTPIDGARISSHFGMRKHPIYGFSRMHTGVDFAAPRGTPVFAAGDGKIEYMGRNGGYGNYVRIRHNGSFQTAYGHMKGFARHLGAGHRVEQGDVIGYVGSTGVSTGPHLHYEIIQNGQKINPLELKLPSGIKLTGRELARFQAHREKVRRRFRALGEEIPSGDGLVAEVSATSSSVVPARATQ